MITSPEEQWRQWHAGHEQRRAAPHGFLAITGLHWLTAEPQTFPDAPGAWRSGPDGVTVELGDATLLVDGRTVTGTHHFGPVDEDGVGALWGEALLEIARRGGDDILRPRHPTHPTRAGYAGTPTFAYAPRWVVPGRFVPLAEQITVDTVIDGLTGVETVVGRVEFEGMSLLAFAGDNPATLVVRFTDATSGVTTWPSHRSLVVAAPGPDGAVTLDFNRATNPPCAYSEFATCSLPPRENRLPVAVEAGERWPGLA